MKNIKHYEIRENLGSGGMGVVYKAFDSVLERDVAIKVMHTHLLDDPKNAERFLREARAAARLVHPNVVTIYEIGEADCGRYIVMEYVQGVSLSRYLKNNGPLGWEKSLNIMKDILSALQSAHSLDILHRDIKSDNILITNEEVIKILDFGIAKIKSQAGMTAEGDILGTAEYMAPEQMLGETLDTRCDIYAAGTVFYQLLTGKLPFAGDTPVTVFYQKLNEDPPPPSFYQKEVHQEIDQIALKSLNRKRENRWQSAKEFSAALQKFAEKQTIVSASSFSETDSEIPYPKSESTEVTDSDQFQSVFIGRHKEFKELMNIFLQAKRSKGKAVLIQGEAGVGKTTLAEHFRDYAEINKAWVLYGACLYQEGMDAYLPYIDALRGFFSKESYSLPEEERQKIKDIVREKVPILMEFTERFTTTFGKLGSQDLQMENGQKINLFEGIYLLISLISERRPVVLVIDDLQWADEASLRLFHYLARQVSGNRILQIGISRTDRNDLQNDGKPTPAADVLLRMRREGICKEFNLRRLTREENDALIDETLGRTLLSDDFYNLIYEETKGNPFFVIESLKVLRESNKIFVEDNAWHNRPDLKKIVVPNRVEDVFIRRLSTLDETERDILQVASVFGNKFAGSNLAMVLEEPKIKLLKKLQRIERELQILSSTEDGFQFEHPMLRELLYEEIPHALQREYHLMIAEHFEKIYNGDYGALVGDVAEHFRRGGNLPKAIPLLYQAGQRSFRLSAYNEVCLFFENLIESVEKHSESLTEDMSWVEIYLKLAISQEEVGRWDDSMKNYFKLLNYSEEHSEIKGQIDALLRLGRMHTKQGKWDKALEAWEKCLVLVKEHPIPSGLSRIYNNIGIIHFQKGDFDLAMAYFDKTLKYADNGYGAYDKANALTNMGSISNIRGDYQKALGQYQEALELYQEKNHVNGEAQVYHNMGMTYSDMGAFEDAIGTFQKCFRMAKKAEDKTLDALTKLNVSKVYLKQKKYREAKKYADKALKFFKRVSDVLSVAEINFIYGSILLEEGDFERAEQYLLESIKINQDGEYWEGFADACEVYADLCKKQNELEKAEAYYQKSIAALRKIDLNEKAESIEQKVADLHENVDFETKEGEVYA